mmetsp:Transcript_27917/g.88938  ORF Transcript_27917/g.88938 Transcript_27917/m.88938 type:complete len:186 (-) Transcript_27917:139-696(-)
MARLTLLLLAAAPLAGAFNAASLRRPRTGRLQLRMVKQNPLEGVSEVPATPEPEVSGTMLSVEEPTAAAPESKLPLFIDPNTNGGVIGLTVIGITVPILFYNVLISVTNLNPDQAGSAIGVGFTVLSVIVWTASYIFRVANKDMTYAQQLRDYENAVLAKRLEELEDDEVEALMDEISDPSSPNQ